MKLFWWMAGLIQLLSFDLFAASTNWEQVEDLMESLSDKEFQFRKADDLRCSVLCRSAYQNNKKIFIMKMSDPVSPIDNFVPLIRIFYKCCDLDAADRFFRFFLQRTDGTVAHLLKILDDCVSLNIDIEEQMYILDCIENHPSVSIVELDQMVSHYIRLGYTKELIEEILENMTTEEDVAIPKLENIIEKSFMFECSPFRIERMLDRMFAKDGLTIIQMENVILRYRIIGVDKEKITKMNHKVAQLKRPPKRLPPLVK